MSRKNNDSTAPPLLVIIISAYKHQYLENTLLSLTRQTDPNFLVFIGDDASHPRIAEISHRYADNLNINYHRFEENLGSQSLIGQWERCIAMTDAPWVMLLGDDDMIDADCIATFYSYLSIDLAKENHQLYRFNTRIIDRNGTVIRENPIHPDIATTVEFLESRFTGASSYVVEFIFSRNVHRKMGGFVNFPLAWCSDDATWAKFSLESGIICLGGPKVSWRLSGDNISSLNPAFGRKKLDANLLYLDWINENIIPILNLEILRITTLRNGAANWFLQSVVYSKINLDLTDLIRYSYRLRNFYSNGFFSFFIRIFKIKINCLIKPKKVN